MADAVRQVVSTGLACAFAFVLAALHLREQQARSELAVANAKLREFGAQAEELATMRERTRVARDIHDGLGHHLTVVGMQVQAARAVLATDPGSSRGPARPGGGPDTAGVDVGAGVGGGAAGAATYGPPSDQLRTLAAESATAGLPTTVDVDGGERWLPDDVQVALHRAAQEGLTNVRKHASAQAAKVNLAYLEDSVSLEIVDDGRGLGPGSGFGLVGIRERVEGLGGSVTIESSPGAGVCVRVEVPG